MSFYLLPDEFAQFRQALAHNLPQEQWLVICYCAEWCDTCRDYLNDFRQLAEKWPTHLFVWVDIEENPELLEDDDIEDFPTLLIQGQKGNHFFGPMLPYIGHLDKLLMHASSLPITQNGPPAIRMLLD